MGIVQSEHDQRVDEAIEEDRQYLVYHKEIEKLRYEKQNALNLQRIKSLKRMLKANRCLCQQEDVVFVPKIRLG